MAGGRPSGTVTFLFTDIEGSTRLWEERPEQMRAALVRHDEILRAAIAQHGGYIFATGGDGFAAAFHTPDAGIAAAVRAQEGVSAGPLGGLELRVRMGIHTGIADERNGDYFGEAPTRAARMMGAAWGGQIVCSAVVAQLASRRENLLALGDHQLRDLAEPLSLYQVPSAGGADFPPLRSLDQPLGNLPRSPGLLIGREDLVGPLVERMRNERLVTLTGVGGVGKTTLALHLATECAREFRDGCWVAELAPVRTDDEVATAALAALQLPLRPGRSPLESIVDGLETQQRLVVLDNCEHVLAACRTLAGAILERCPQVRLIATSREGLGLGPEWTATVPSLAVDGLDQMSPAVQLFVERAQRQGGWEPDEADLETIREICQRLDGIPLAIELAAGRIGVLSPRELAGHLDDRFRLLGGSRGAAVERHQTLRAAVEWSYGLLDDPEREVFTSLGVFAGSFDLDAARAVAGGDRDQLDTLEILDSLSRQSLLTVERSRSGSRYRLLETLRQFAVERLRDGGGAAVTARRRHAQFHAAEVEHLAEGLRGPGEVAATLALGRLMSDIRAALTFAVDDSDSAVAARLVGPFHNTPVMTRHEVTSMAAPAVVELAGEDERWGPAVLVLSAWDAYLSADADRRRAALKLLERTKRAPDIVVASEAHRAAGALEALEGGDARSEAREAHQTAMASGDEYQRVNALVALAAWEAAFGSPRPDLANEALEGARNLGNPALIGWSTFIAAYAIEMTEPDRALDIIEAADVQLGDRDETSATSRFSVAGRILLRRGEYRRALAALRRTLLTTRRDDLRTEFSYSATASAGCLAALGAAEDAAIVHAALRGSVPWVNQLDAEALAESIIAGALEPDRREALVHRGEHTPFDEAAELTMRAIDTELARAQPPSGGGP